MNILFVIPYTPSLIRSRSYNLLRGLTRHGHQLTLATFWENEVDRKDLETLSMETGIRVVAFPLGKLQSLIGMGRAITINAPLQTQYSWHPKMARAILKEATDHRYDVIHVEHLRGSPYGLILRASLANQANQVPIIYDSVDSISLIYEKAFPVTRNWLWKQIIRFELPRTRKWEAHLVQTFDRVLVTSPIDAANLVSLGAIPIYNRARPPFSEDRLKEKIFVLGHGVDVGYFTPPDEPRQVNQIVFSGKMSYHANSSAAIYLVEEVMPRVWSKKPDASLILAGKSPTRQMREMAKRNPNILVTGGVPDLRPYLRQATVAVAPITYGAGIQNKVLEAMACATPVVATSLAVSALSAVPDKDVLVADTAQSLAEKILFLLGDSLKRDEIGANGRKYVEKHHDWDKIVFKAEQYYRQGSSG